jgi:AraC-like DNA-binding protein
MSQPLLLAMTSLSEAEGAWEAIVRLIQRHLLPAIEANGAEVFQTPALLAASSERSSPSLVRRLYPPLTQQAPVWGFLVRGTGEVLVHQTVLSLTAGQGFWVPPGVTYIPHITRGNFISASEWLWFAAYPQGILLNRCQVTPTEHRSSPIYLVADSSLSDLARRWASRPLPQPTGKWLLLTFFGLLTETTPLVVTAPDELAKPLSDLPFPLQWALDYLRRHYAKPFSLRALSSHCGVTPSHLCRLFRKHLKATPVGYLQRIRLTVARQLLAETSWSVQSIAALVGFSDVRHFRRQFVRHFGLTPQQVRRLPSQPLQ